MIQVLPPKNVSFVGYFYDTFLVRSKKIKRPPRYYGSNYNLFDIVLNKIQVIAEKLLT